MVTGLIILHVVVSVLLTIVVLLQFGKGAEVGAMMGSTSSQAVFSAGGKGNFFTKLTTFLAIAFMANSIALTTITSNKNQESIFDDTAPLAPQLNSDKVPAPVEKTNAADTKKKK